MVLLCGRLGSVTGFSYFLFLYAGKKQIVVIFNMDK